MTQPSWYSHNTAGDQCVVVEDGTGRDVAVCYDRADGPLVAAAPRLLAALQNALNVMAGVATGDLAPIRRDSPAIREARDAIALVDEDL